MNQELVEAVRQKLRLGGIKLWLSPYCIAEQPVNSAILALMPTLFDRGCSPFKGVSDEDLLECLQQLQERAIKNLRAKSTAASSPPAGGTAGAQLSTAAEAVQEIAAHDTPGGIAVHVKVVGASVPEHARAEHSKPNTLRLPSIALSTTGAEMERRLMLEIFGNDAGMNESSQRNAKNTMLRLIVGGRRIAHDDVIIGQGKRLQSRDGTLSMLAIFTQMEVEPVEKAPNREENITQKAHMIRKAAKLMAKRDFHRGFELTDQHGRAVPLAPQEQENLCVALSLHSLGKEVLRRKCEKRVGIQHSAAAGGEPSISMDVDGTSGESETERTSEAVHGEALAVFLEADAAWEKVGEVWQRQVDNYGLLQLDITWCLLKLEQLGALPDAAARIRRTEAVLSKQVNPNFLKIAILNAEEGRPVPPLAAPFVRLLLLTGVVKLGHERNAQGAIDTLEQAKVLCNALMINPESVNELLQLGASQQSAVVALRKSGGDLQRASEYILDQVEQGRAAAQDRATQRKFGLTANKAGYVNLALIETVKDFMAVNHNVAVALLRLSNNSIDDATDIWQNAHRQDHVVIERANHISWQPQKRHRPAVPETRATSAKQPLLLQPVDELTLVTLMSAVPGIDRELAESAVRATGHDIEAAMLWLTLATKEEVPTLVTKEEVEQTRDGDEDEEDDAEEDGGEADAEAGSPEGGTRTERELENERWEEAEELLHRELGNSLQNKTDLTEEHLGLLLHQEKELIDHYLVLALSQVAGPAAVSGPAGGGGRK